MLFSNNPKELRAMAKKLNAMAAALEMQADPEKFIKKKLNSKVNGVKRKMKNQVIKKMGL
jgi:hypothetical protein